MNINLENERNLSMLVDFYEFTIDDIKLIDYEYHPAIKMEVSV